MVGAEDHRPGLRDVLAADPREAEVEVEEGLQDRAHQPVDERVDALVAGARVQRGVCRCVAASRPAYPGAERVVTVPEHVARRTDPARRPRRCHGRRGVGRAAAARPARLRRPLRRRGAARPLGRAAPTRLAAGRRRAAPRQRRAVRRRLRQRRAVAAGPAGAARAARRASPSTWRPGRGTAALAARAPGRRATCPQLWGSGRAFAQATWRHLLFGAVLGRARAPAEPARGRRRADRRRDRLDERPRLGRAPRRPRPRRRPERARVLITGATGLRRARTSRAHCAAAGDERRRALARARAGVDLLDAAARRARASPRRAPDVVYHLAALAHVGRSWREPGGDARAEPGDDAQRARGGARATRRRPSWSRSPPARSTARRRRCRSARTRRCARRTRTRSPRRRPTCSPGFYADAHGLRVVRAARVQPLRAGPAAALRARLLRPPGRGGARGGRRPDPRRHRQPGRAARLHRRARRRARLPAARRRRARPGVFNVCSGRSRSARELVAALGDGRRASRSTTSSTRRSCARTR